MCSFIYLIVEALPRTGEGHYFSGTLFFLEFILGKMMVDDKSSTGCILNIVVVLSIQSCPTLGDFVGKNSPCHLVKHNFFRL